MADRRVGMGLFIDPFRNSFSEVLWGLIQSQNFVHSIFWHGRLFASGDCWYGLLGFFYFF